MFDFLIILWWILQTIAIGLLINEKIFINKTDSFIYSPISGLSLILILGSVTWFWNVRNSVAISIYLAVLFISFFNFYQKCRKIRLNSTSWSWYFSIFLGVALILSVGSFIPFSEKLFQAYPLDRFGYASASILFQKFPLSYFTDAIARLEFNGDIRSYLNNPILPMAMIEAKARVAPEIAFIFVNFLTPNDLYRLTNAWEVYFRVMQFFGAYALIYLVTRAPIKSLCIALPIIFSYWLQYQKDFNAWAHLVTVAYLFYIIAFIYQIEAQFDKFGTNKNKYFLYFLILAMVISHPEFAILLLLGLMGSAVVASKNLRVLFIGSRRAYLQILSLMGLILLAHPYIISWLIRMFKQSPGMTGGISDMARGFYYIFSTNIDRYSLVENLVGNPIEILLRPEVWSGIVVSLTGFSPIAFLGSVGSILLFSVIIGVTFIAASEKNLDNKNLKILNFYYRNKSLILGFVILSAAVLIAWYSNYYTSEIESKKNINNIASIFCGSALIYFFIISINRVNFEKFKFIFIFFAYLTLVFAVFTAIHSYGGAYRMIGIWGSLSTLLFTVVLWTSLRKYTKPFAIFSMSFYMAMGISVFFYQNHGGFEKYPSFYPNSTGFRHFEISSVRDKWDYDYRELIPELLLCKSVYINLPTAKEFMTRAPRFFQANIMLFLENNGVPYYLSNPILNSGILGDPMYMGYKSSQNIVCELGQEEVNGIIKYRLSKSQADNFRGE